VQTGGKKSQSFIAILLIVFCQHLIVNPVLDTKHKYASCFRSIRTYYQIVLLNCRVSTMGWVESGKKFHGLGLVG